MNIEIKRFQGCSRPRVLIEGQEIGGTWPQWLQDFVHCVEEEGLTEARARLDRMSFPSRDTVEERVWREAYPHGLPLGSMPMPVCGCTRPCEGMVGCPHALVVTCGGGE
jgi:hypothetical protein